MSLRDISDITRLGVVKKIIEVIDYFMSNDIDASRVKGQLDISNIPPAGLDNVVKVDTVTDMLALTIDNVQNGDTVMIIGVTPPAQYQVIDDTKLGTMDAFQEYAAGTATKALADINGNNIHTTYGKLAGNNTWTGINYWNGSAIFNANLTILGSATTPGDATGNLYLTNSEDGYTYINNGSNSVADFGNATIRFYKPTYITNGSSAGSSATLYLGVKPTNETVQARIGTDNLGGLFYHASTNQPHVFRIGTNNNVFVIRNDDTKVTFSSNDIPFATVTHDGVAKWLGNANTATKLKTARTINGVAFDGTANITIADSTKLPIAGGTMTGDLTLKGNPTADLMAATKKYVDDSVTSAGGGDVLAAGNNSFTGANTFQNLVTMVGGVVFTSGTTTLAWKNATQIVATINASTYTGNSATATKLATARTITANLASSTAGSFDGSANITVGVTGTLPIANGGTGATTAAAARTALGCAPAYTYSTTDLTAGSSALTTGTLYIVYE